MAYAGTPACISQLAQVWRRSWKRRPANPHGAMFCEVRINGVTGETRVSRLLGSFDTGRIINPKTARSQFRGGIIMGLGMALME